MKKILIYLILFLMIILPINIKAEARLIEYQAHVSDVGWQNYVKDGDISGTTGKSKSIESLKIRLNIQNSGINYQVYSSKYRWQDIVENDTLSGTTGKSIPIEAIRMNLTGEASNNYDIYYRVHVSNIGWLGWTSNGNAAGTTGYNNRNIEAIQIRLIPKGSNAPGNTNDNYRENYIVEYQAHVSNVGWQTTKYNGEVAGTTGQGKKIEAIAIAINNKSLKGNIYYQTYVQGSGWQSEKNEGIISGTTGQSKRIEAIKIRITDEIAKKYNIFYRVHVQDKGWLGWTSNGNIAGTIGYNKRLEAIEIRLVLKEDNSIINEQNSFLQKDSTISYSSHVQDVGWMNYKNDGETSGSVGKSKRIEAIKIKMSNESEQDMISYQTHVSNIGWTSYVKGNSISGTTGQGKRIEAIRIKLNNEYEEKYDIYYRVHVQDIGWMDWASNGNAAGTSGASLRVEAIEIKMVLKGTSAPGNTLIPYREAKWITKDGNQYYYDIYGNMTTGSKVIGDKTYYFGPTGIYLGNNHLKVIDVSYYQGNIDWNKVANSGIYGVILRIGYWNKEDIKFKEYISEVKRLGIPYGIYLFSYASTENGATTEANFTNSIINKYNLDPTLGIYYDIEDYWLSSFSQDVSRPTCVPSNNLSDVSGCKETYDKISKTYINKVSSYIGGRYKVKIYANLYFTNNGFGEYTRSQVDWIAQYNSSCSYTGKYSMWQYTSSATLDGINGSVDMNILY